MKGNEYINCEVCGSRVKRWRVVGCRHCNKTICYECYGTFSRPRACCGKETG